MNIQNISSLPDFIDKFIKFNHDKLIEIYDEGIKVHNEGLLYFECDKEKNNVDVFFLYKEKIEEMKLRSLVRRGIKIILERKEKEINSSLEEEMKLRKIISNMIL